MSLTDLTKGELSRLIVALDGSGFEPDLMQKLRRMQAERASQRERGELVFQWLLPLVSHRTYVPKSGEHKGQVRTAKLTLCPTMNEYGSMKVWARSRLYEELDARILALLHDWPKALLRNAPRPRAVRLSRASSHRVDEISVDSGGGKVPIDRLVKRGILRGDAPKDLAREAEWRHAPPGKSSLLIEVFELV